MNKKLFRNLEIAGTVFILILATFLHFVYDLSKGNALASIFGAVNESVWENTKIFLFAYLIWAVIEFLCAKIPFKQFVVSKVIGAYFLGISIILLFYFYNIFTKGAVVYIDISIGVLMTILSQIISYRLVLGDRDLKEVYIPSLFFLALLLIMLFSFSIYPPKFPLFRDEATGFYGVIPDYADKGAAALNKVSGIRS
ncbi:MAG: DUF6512 family protein [Acutalibacteraceae bacterium]